MRTTNWTELFIALDYINKNIGISVMSQPAKMKTLLLDLAPNAKKESRVFLGILAERVLIKKIQNSQDVSFEYIVQQIEDLSGLTEEWAKNITEALFRGNGITVSKPTKSVLT